MIYNSDDGDWLPDERNIAQYNTEYHIMSGICFKASFVRIKYQRNGLLCSLEGEFLREDKPFEPPLPYEMENVGVPTPNVPLILKDIYYSLLSERGIVPYDPLAFPPESPVEDGKIDDDLF